MAKLCDMPLSTTIRSQKEKQLNELQLRGICKNVLHFHSVWGIKEKSSSYKYHYKFPSKTRPSYKFSFCKANASFFSATVFPDLPLLAPACPYGPRHSTSRHVTSRRAYTLWGFPHLSVTGAKHGTAQQVKADRKCTRLNSSHSGESRMPSSA